VAAALFVAVLVVPIPAHAQRAAPARDVTPCGVGPRGTTWRLGSQRLQIDGPGGREGAMHHWLERVTSARTAQGAWSLTLVRVALDAAERRDTMRADARTRRTPRAAIAPARVTGRPASTRVAVRRDALPATALPIDAPPCAALAVGTSWRAPAGERGDTLGWRVTRLVDTLGVRAAELSADRERVDTLRAAGQRIEGGAGVATRETTLVAAGVAQGTESWRRIVRIDDGMLLHEVMERREVGRMAGAPELAGSVTRLLRVERHPIADVTAALLLDRPRHGDSAAVVTARESAGRAWWRRAGDTIEVHRIPSDGWRSQARLVWRDGAVLSYDETIPLREPAIMRWRVEGGRIVSDHASAGSAPVPTGPWAMITDMAWELAAPMIVTLPRDGRWHDATLVVPSRARVASQPVRLRVQPVAGRLVVHIAPPQRCLLQVTMLLEPDGTPLLVNDGGPFGETTAPVAGSPRHDALQAALRAVPRERLSPTVSLADQAAGRC
jgi:hypothetical protein